MIKAQKRYYEKIKRTPEFRKKQREHKAQRKERLLTEPGFQQRVAAAGRRSYMKKKYPYLFAVSE